MTNKIKNHCFRYISPQKSPKIAQKRITQSQFAQIFFIGMVYFLWYVVNPHVQTAQNLYGKGV